MQRFAIPARGSPDPTGVRSALIGTRESHGVHLDESGFLRGESPGQTACRRKRRGTATSSLAPKRILFAASDFKRRPYEYLVAPTRHVIYGVAEARPRKRRRFDASIVSSTTPLASKRSLRGFDAVADRAPFAVLAAFVGRTYGARLVGSPGRGAGRLGHFGALRSPFLALLLRNLGTTATSSRR